MSENSTPQIFVTECNDCSTTVRVEALSTFTNFSEYDPMDSEKISFCRCPNCNSPILLKQLRDFDEVEGLFWRPPAILFPGNPFHVNPEIPDKLKEALYESILCHKARSHTATVIMCRRTLEGFCSHMGIQERSLEKSIKRLNDLGLVNSQLYEWANELRLAGNEAAHNIDIQFSELDSKDILDFTIAILDYTFSFKIKFDRFKKRKEVKSHSHTGSGK